MKNILLLINILLFPYLISAQPTSSDLGIDSDIIIFDHYFHAQARDAKYSSTRYAYWGHAGGTKYRTSSQYTALNLNGTLGSIFGEASSYASGTGRINDYEWSLNTANLMYGVYEYGAGTDWYESGYSTPKARWGNWLGLGGNNQTTRTLVSNMTQNSYETIVDRISYAMGLEGVSITIAEYWIDVQVFQNNNRSFDAVEFNLDFADIQQTLITEDTDNGSVEYSIIKTAEIADPYAYGSLNGSTYAGYNSDINDLLSVTGSTLRLNLTGVNTASFTLLITPEFSINADLEELNTILILAIPEPSTYAQILGGLALSTILIFRKKRRIMNN